MYITIYIHNTQNIYIIHPTNIGLYASESQIVILALCTTHHKLQHNELYQCQIHVYQLILHGLYIIYKGIFSFLPKLFL